MFTHLHLHTQFSLLDGACRLDRLVCRAKELGMTSLAITDHGNMYGAVDFYKECKRQGIKPIIGCEVYVAPRTRFDKEKVLDKEYNHLVLLVKNEIGYKNLIKMVSLSYTEGFYFKPRIDCDLLENTVMGLFASRHALPVKFRSFCSKENMMRRGSVLSGLIPFSATAITISKFKITVFRSKKRLSTALFACMMKQAFRLLPQMMSTMSIKRTPKFSKCSSASPLTILLERIPGLNFTAIIFILNPKTKCHSFFCHIPMQLKTLKK